MAPASNAIRHGALLTNIIQCYKPRLDAIPLTRGLEGYHLLHNNSPVENYRQCETTIFIRRTLLLLIVWAVYTRAMQVLGCTSASA